MGRLVCGDKSGDCRLAGSSVRACNLPTVMALGRKYQLHGEITHRRLGYCKDFGLARFLSGEWQPAVETELPLRWMGSVPRDRAGGLDAVGCQVL
jgi:hypothetical protein